MVLKMHNVAEEVEKRERKMRNETKFSTAMKKTSKTVSLCILNKKHYSHSP